MNLQSTLNILTMLARDTGAEMLSTIELAASGATLSLHWSGVESNAMPREANLYFGEDAEGNPDVFLWSFVIDPTVYCWCVDEGLDDTKATDAATRLVESIEEVTNYLVGDVYKYYIPNAVPAKTKHNSNKSL